MESSTRGLNFHSRRHAGDTKRFVVGPGIPPSVPVATQCGATSGQRSGTRGVGRAYRHRAGSVEHISRRLDGARIVNDCERRGRRKSGALACRPVSKANDVAWTGFPQTRPFWISSLAKVSSKPLTHAMFIAIVGTPSAGKRSVLEYLIDRHGFKQVGLEVPKDQMEAARIVRTSTRRGRH